MADIELFWLVLGGVTIGGAFAAVILEYRNPTPKPGDDDDDDLWWWSIK